LVLTDFLVLGIVLLFAIWALVRGFVGTVLWISGWVAAAFATIYGLSSVEPIARDLIENETVAKAAAGAALFIFTLILVSVVSSAIAQQVRGSMLGAVDRSLGFLAGLGIGGSVVALGYLLMTWAIADPTRLPQWVANARTLPAVQQVAAVLTGLVPAETRTASVTEADRLREHARRASEMDRLVRDLSGGQTPAPAPTGPATTPLAAGETPRPVEGTPPPADARGQQLNDLIRRTLGQ
jgi:membrane protein required for colicin V production